ncbi:hypothetical protein LPJ53_004369 [Coemansia erecta]|uniref:Fungal-type protein kinase domain-containing protein n=1 Tax=Coemansia erecta TaxID=147472 RepID=A0A9W8CP91_9FUNG|nr:hypothetical protein LPJ53_004369 [Coemansia erecta]
MDFPNDGLTPSKNSGQPAEHLVDSFIKAQSRVAAQSTSFIQCDSTPYAQKIRMDFAKHTARETIRARREKLATSLAGETMEFTDLISYLGLESQYEEYDAKSASICNDLLERIPAFERGMLYTADTEVPIKENLLVQWFESIYNHLESLDSGHYISSPPTTRYIYENHETAVISGTSIKPGGVVFYGDFLKKEIDNVHLFMEAKVEGGSDCLFMEALGQMAEYAHCVWQAQPTRVFVPVVYLYGVEMDLILFARSGYRRIALGEYLYNSCVISKSETDLIVDSIRGLWFLLIQPPEKFGHFTGISRLAPYLLFEDDKISTTVKRARKESDDTLKIKSRISRKVGVNLRTAYLLVVRYKGGDAVLKLSWAPVERQPEGALYDILQRGEVDYIPHIYRSGVIVPDFLGYRLEYILMEHCGEPLVSVFKADASDPTKKEKLFSDASSVVQKVCACLLQAARAGVLHRDVSAGNITLRDGKVFLMDWGFGKVIPATLDGNTKKLVNSTWGIDLDKITKNEDARDGVTGTVLFMGVRVLMGLTSHSVFDDIESVLYVVLAVLSYIGPSKSGTNVSELGKATHWIQATSKIGCMADGAHYLRHFGVSEWSESLRHLLDALRNILFVKNGVFIGGNLLSANIDERAVDEYAFKIVLGDKHFGRCFPDSTLVASDAEGINASLKRRFETAAITDSDSDKSSKIMKKPDNQENTDPNVFSS